MKAGKFGNKAAKDFVKSLPVTSVESTQLVKKIKFNFAFLDLSQPVDIDKDLTNGFLKILLDKLKHFSVESLAYWNGAPVGGKNGNYYESYGKFPKPSNFTHPPFVPHDAVWGRFRLDSSTRVAGFTVPAEMNHSLCEAGRYRLCTNTFYVVFIDLHHNFYVMK
jgi:hypothetical protein